MANQGRYILRAVLVLLAAVVIVATLRQIIWEAFLHNPALNGLILAVLGFGIAYNFRRILQLRPERRWIGAYRNAQSNLALHSPPRLLAAIANVLGERERLSKTGLNALSMRYLLDSTSARLDESRDIARYQTGLLIFLGLLGTFWGLLTAISAVGSVISGLGIGSGDVATLFNEMKAGLTQPLSGMGTAFSSSLFGLAGSLVLGFLDLQASQAQNSFYNELEEWLSGMARLNLAEGNAVEFAGSPPLPVYIQALLEQTAENLDRLQITVARSEEGRHQLNSALLKLNERMAELTQQIGRQQDLLAKMGNAQDTLARELGRETVTMLDEATRGHIRNADLQLGRVADEVAREREELKHELKLVVRAIAIAAGEPVPPLRG